MDSWGYLVLSVDHIASLLAVCFMFFLAAGGRIGGGNDGSDGGAAS